MYMLAGTSQIIKKDGEIMYCENHEFDCYSMF